MWHPLGTCALPCASGAFSPALKARQLAAATWKPSLQHPLQLRGTGPGLLPTWPRAASLHAIFISPPFHYSSAGRVSGRVRAAMGTAPGLACEQKQAVALPPPNAEAMVAKSSISPEHTLVTRFQLSLHGVLLRCIRIFLTALEFNPREMVLMIKDFIDSVLVSAMRTKEVI